MFWLSYFFSILLLFYISIGGLFIIILFLNKSSILEISVEKRLSYEMFPLFLGRLLALQRLEEERRRRC